VEEGDVRRVRNIIDRVQLATARTRQGLTPLHVAVAFAQTDTIRFLLNKFPHTVNEVDRVGPSV
jgi:ankyrin repeat protein